MRIRALVALVAAALLSTALGTGGASAAYGPGVDYFSFRDARLNESSGVVASSKRDGVFFTHNDSGDTARFFAVDDRGCTLATYDLAGFDAASFQTGHDVEDIARSPGSVWLADIGDNNHQRTEIAVYRVDEPNVDASPHRSSEGCRAAEATVVEAETYRLAYVDHPHDAETLLADPATGQLFVVTKTPAGQSTVYAAPVPLLPGAVNVLVPVAAIAFPPSTTYDRDPVAQAMAPSTQIGFDVAGRLMAVGGDVAPGRDRLVIRTYTDAYEWTIPAGAVSLADAFLAGLPTQIPLRYERQGEAIAYSRDASFLVTTCEDVGCTAHRY